MMTEQPTDRMETQSEALTRLQAAGYDVDVRIDDDGGLLAGERLVEVSALTIDETVRFEGMSNPDDEAILLAVRGEEGWGGTLLLPYGPDVTADQAAVMRGLLRSS